MAAPKKKTSDKRPFRVRLLDRSTGDLLVLMISFTVCWSILASGATVAAISFFRPDQDVSVWVTRVAGIMNTMIGLLAGFLAGRTDSTIQLQHAQAAAMREQQNRVP